MSRRGDRGDNAPAESFFGTLKVELIHDALCPTPAEAWGAMSECIEVIYNQQWRELYLGFLRPPAFERQWCHQHRPA